jgi:hypothetical protein
VDVIFPSPFRFPKSRLRSKLDVVSATMRAVTMSTHPSGAESLVAATTHPPFPGQVEERLQNGRRFFVDQDTSLSVAPTRVARLRQA